MVAGREMAALAGAMVECLIVGLPGNMGREVSAARRARAAGASGGREWRARAAGARLSRRGRGSLLAAGGGVR